VSEIERISDQLKRAFEGEAWHGPAVRELLATTTCGQAAQRPIAGAHTIWEIVVHMSAWESVVRRRLLGETVADLAPEQDWPAVTNVTEAAWRKTLEELEKSHAQTRQAIAQLSDERLDDTVSGKNYSVYVMLHGVIQHDLYHAGQIAVLKKALA
jgi:uncharacterized damage-inducible protein DinB